MDAENINAVSTAVIAFVTVIGAIAGLYYHLWQVGTSIHNIIILEIAFIILIVAFMEWIKIGSRV